MARGGLPALAVPRRALLLLALAEEARTAKGQGGENATNATVMPPFGGEAKCTLAGRGDDEGTCTMWGPWAGSGRFVYRMTWHASDNCTGEHDVVALTPSGTCHVRHTPAMATEPLVRRALVALERNSTPVNDDDDERGADTVSIALKGGAVLKHAGDEDEADANSTATTGDAVLPSLLRAVELQDGPPQTVSTLVSCLETVGVYEAVCEDDFCGRCEDSLTKEKAYPGYNFTHGAPFEREAGRAFDADWGGYADASSAYHFRIRYDPAVCYRLNATTSVRFACAADNFRATCPRLFPSCPPSSARAASSLLPASSRLSARRP